MPAYMRLLDSDLLTIAQDCVDGKLDRCPIPIKWKLKHVANVVLASGGYPGEYKKGFPITGIKEAEKIPGVKIFHAGTVMDDGVLKTNGGRVLDVTATGNTLPDALQVAYQAAKLVDFHGKQFRRGIGAKSLTQVLA
jgi:phosphoribosylamine---glycine ligase